MEQVLTRLIGQKGVQGPMTSPEDGGGGPVTETADHHQTRSPHHHDQAADGVQSSGGHQQGESRESSFFVTGNVDRSDELLEWYAEDDPVGGEL